MKNLTKPCVNNRRAIWYIPVAKIRYNPAIRLLPHRQDLPPVQSEGVNNTMVTARGTSKESQSVSNPGYGVYTIYGITKLKYNKGDGHLYKPLHRYG